MTLEAFNALITLTPRVSEVQVGFHKDDHNFPVYAHLLLKNGGISYPSFHVNKSDASKSNLELNNGLVGYNKINYTEKYATATPEESKKAVYEDLLKAAASESKLCPCLHHLHVSIST